MTQSIISKFSGTSVWESNSRDGPSYGLNARLRDIIIRNLFVNSAFSIETISRDGHISAFLNKISV